MAEPGATIYLIRHAEKPCQVGNDSYLGVTAKGEADKEALIPRGWQRAGAWTVFFGASGGLPAPTAVFASDDLKDKADKLGSNSKRPRETVTGVAARVLGAKPDVTYLEGDEPALVRAITALGGVTLVCWQHQAIPAIARLIAPAAAIPSPWPGDRFDVVWRFRRAAGASGWSFDQVCPNLLAGDSPLPIVSAG